MVVLNVSKLSEYEERVKSPNLVVIHFYADWAEQCERMNDVLEELAKQTELNCVHFIKLAAEDLPEISLKHQVTSVPTFVLLRGGNEVERINGANAAELTQKINQQLSKGSLENSFPVEHKKDDLKTRLTELVKQAPVMLFMKGNAKEPRCGFSRTIIQILDSYNVSYKTFDILSDEDVRQGLKEFSNWPTYPQLYVNGELIGGLDIVKEMHESGELKNALPEKGESLDERLKSLINKAPCMIFMKGSPDTPRCGFSRQLMEIMKETKVPFDTFDILTDEEVRQGLKTFSNWPTYPQVYAKGELIGGLDIINELKANGELISSLEGSS